MADYWVSRERHYCKFCNVWMQSDKLSIKHHEQGRKHKDKVEETLKHKRQAKSDANNAQKELQDQLKEIEEVAQAKYELDMAKRRAPPPPPRKPGQAPPPPPRRPGRSSGNAVNTAVATPTTTSAIVPSSKPPNRGQYHHPIQQEAELEDEEEEEDSNGVYAVRGIVYLEGKKHDSQLETGSACQIWVEEAEQWIDALVEQATVHTVPNTELSFRRFSVMYMLPPSEEAEQKGEKAQPMTEREVLADRLRIPLPLNVTLEAAEKMVEQWRNGGDATQGEAIPNVMIDETTGMGEWSTVKVRQIDESPEAVAKRAAEAEAEAEHLAEEQKRLDALEDFSGQGDNALGAFNPWGGSYKGVNLDDGSAAPADGSSASAPKREEEINISTNGNVSFKKRGQKKQKRRRIHTDDE